MKKILCLILALCCVFSIVSCGGNGKVDPEQAFFDAVASSKATQIKTLTYYTVEGESNPFNGTFETTVKDDGNFTFSYSYTRIAKLEDADDPAIAVSGNRATVSGTVYYQNGKYSTDGENWFTEAPEVLGNQPKLNLDKSKLGNYVMNDSKTTLTATLTVEKAAEVLGMTLGATSDVVVTVSTNGTYLTRVSIEYTKGEANVRIDTSYS